MNKWADPVYRKQKMHEYYLANKAKLNAQSNAYQKAYPEKHRAYQRKSKYGLTLQQQTELLSTGCMICGQTATHIDHCHSTNTVRGALCNNCNTGLGMFKDSQELLKRAVFYLRLAERKRLEAFAF